MKARLRSESFKRFGLDPRDYGFLVDRRKYREIADPCRTQLASLGGAESRDEAKEWVEKATAIFKTGDNAPYLDSLMETRHIPNIMLPPGEAK